MNKIEWCNCVAIRLEIPQMQDPFTPSGYRYHPLHEVIEEFWYAGFSVAETVTEISRTALPPES